MTRKLLVSTGDAEQHLSPAREELVAVLADVKRLDVDVQVAAFSDGPFVDALRTVADVHLIEPLDRGSASGRLEGAVRRVSSSAAARIQDMRSAAVRRELGAPDAILLIGAAAMPVLRFVTSPRVPVTAYVHPWDHGVSSLPPRDRRELVARVDRFLIADESVVEDLLSSGVDPARIELAPGFDGLVPEPPPGVEQARRARAELGLPVDQPVVVVPPVPGWADLPDLTLGLAWQLEQAPGPTPVVLWYGMDADEPGAWELAYDVTHMRLQRLRIEPRLLSWDEVIDLADLVVLPLDWDGDLPVDFARTAAVAARPIACWEGDVRATTITDWGGFTVARGDVAAMADRIRSGMASVAARRRARAAAWRPLTAELERLMPLGLMP